MELTDKEEKRVKKLQQILTKLQNGEHVQNRMLKTWLTEDEFSAIEYEWKNQKELREELKDKPDDIIEYEKRLKKALFAYNKADNHSSRGNSKAAKKGFGNADTHFERLLEYLQEILYADRTLEFWFDRNISFEHGEEPGLDPISIPRVVNSRSLDCQAEHHLKQCQLTKNQVKQNIVESALCNINSKTISPNLKLKQSAKLKDMLSKIKK